MNEKKKSMIRNVVLPPGIEVVDTDSLLQPSLLEDVESSASGNTVIDTIEYLHKCGQYDCHRCWYSELKISHCPSSQHIHIWFNGTSRLK